MEDFGRHKLFRYELLDDARPPLSFLNSAMPTEDLRWTLAHELAHLNDPCNASQ
jgi:Zn-dependent peptidase ImmA (M78 family)